MPHRLALLLALLCALIVFASPAAAGNRQPVGLRQTQSAKTATTLEVMHLKNDVKQQRQATWKWQKVALRAPTYASYIENHTNSVPLLKWAAKLWSQRRLAAQKYAQRIFSNHGYLPPAQARILGHWMAAKFQGWTGDQWSCLDALWGNSKYGTLESGWYAKADNPHSSAHGIPQALPGSKMGPGWWSSAFAQIKWGLGYIKGKFSTPCQALAFRVANHSY